jgi:hypothetical protein
MEYLNKEIDEILVNKTEELNNILKLKLEKRKMTDVDNIDVIDYHSKSTLGKISAEQDRKLKSSKAFKKQSDYANIQVQNKTK